MKVAINGFGRIGRLVFRLIDDDDNFEIVAINNPSGAEQASYLLRFDSIHGSYKKDEISYDEDSITVSGKKVLVFSEKDPKNLPWSDLDIDLVFECTGHFNSLEGASLHLDAGAKKVICSAPCGSDIKTVVYGVNENILDGNDKIISAASCTTNCLAPVLKVLNDNFGVIKGFMTTIHAYTSDQGLLDGSHKKGVKERRGRSAMNMIPTSTGAAKAIGRVLPEMDGKLSGSAIRVPVSDGSLINLVVKLNMKVTPDMINKVFIENKNEVLGATYDAVVSSDIIGDNHGGIVDLSLTEALDISDGELVKIICWYDNEYGYTNQLVRTAKYFLGL